ncbi:MAG TPA: hemerythrin domain-containing protein [Burkholderiaceae bacterium]
MPNTNTSPVPIRIDLYVKIHKALRAQMMAAVASFETLDLDMPAAVLDAVGQLRQLLAFSASHLEKEDAYVHPAMEARRPGSTATIAGDHAHHRQAFEQLRALGDRLLVAGAGQADVLTVLRQQLHLFVADNLSHMQQEETVNNAVLWETHTDHELIAIEMDIVGSLTQEQRAQSLYWMLPALNHAERMHLLQAMRAGMPPPAFEGVLGLARTRLSAAQWQRLEQALAAAAAAERQAA